MATEIYIHHLTGNKKAIRDYAQTIAEMDYDCTNAYVMAYDRCDNILWTIQAGDVDRLKEISFASVKRVEIYDHSSDSDNIRKWENVYVDTQKSLLFFLTSWERIRQEYGYEFCIKEFYGKKKLTSYFGGIAFYTYICNKF